MLFYFCFHPLLVLLLSCVELERRKMESDKCLLLIWLWLQSPLAVCLVQHVCRCRPLRVSWWIRRILGTFSSHNSPSRCFCPSVVFWGSPELPATASVTGGPPMAVSHFTVLLPATWFMFYDVWGTQISVLGFVVTVWIPSWRSHFHLQLCSKSLFCGPTGVHVVDQQNEEICRYWK